jgi:serine/threonine protein kinase
MADRKIGPYRVVGKLGQGGMGEVFEAVHEAIERKVALKVLHPEFARNREFIARFFNEARAVNRVDHPALVQISDYGQLPDGTAYIVMELLRGESLGRRLKRSGARLSIYEALSIAQQVAAALAATHEKGIVHRVLNHPQDLVENLSVQRALERSWSVCPIAAAVQGARSQTRRSRRAAKVVSSPL